jgi:hypothetical protein
VVTLAMQCVVAVLTVVFGIMALRVAHATRRNPVHHRAGWLLTGIVFTILGFSTAIQNFVAAPWAYFAGEGAPAFELYIRYSPAGNHSRGFLVVAYAMMMVGLAGIWRVAHRHFVGVVVGLSLAAMSLGAVVGWREGPLVQVTHWTATAISDSAELIFLLGALFIGVVRNTIDRLLWIALMIFTVHELLDVAWYSALAWSDVPGAWSPPTVYLHMYASVAYMLMIVVVARRIRLARQGVKVPGLIELPERATRSMLG